MIHLWRQVELWIRKHIDEYNKLSDDEKIFGADVQKHTINAIIKAIKEGIYRKRQGIGLPYNIHVKRILFHQIIQERTSIL